MNKIKLIAFFAAVIALGALFLHLLGMLGNPLVGVITGAIFMQIALWLFPQALDW